MPKFVKATVIVEMPGIEPGAFHMQSERATTALHPLRLRERTLVGAVCLLPQCSTSEQDWTLSLFMAVIVG